MNRTWRAVRTSAVAGATLFATLGVGVVTAAAASKGPVFQDGYRCTIVGGPGNDVLHGTPNSVVCGLGGKNTLIAGAGNEVLIGGPGNDKLVASNIKGTVDVLLGNGGNDTLFGGAGTDTLSGGAGNDTLIAGPGSQKLYGGAGVDHLKGGSGANFLSGGAGNDVLTSGKGTTTLAGGAGNDVLTGASAHSNFFGGAGNDVIKLTSGVGAHVDGGSGSNSINCGSSSGTIIVAEQGDSQSSDCHVSGDSTVSLQSYEGVVSAVNPDGTVVVSFSDANDTAQAWLAANGNPTSVTIDLTAATVESDTGSTVAVVGNFIEVHTDTPTSGTILPATDVSLHAADGELTGLQHYHGVISAINPDGTVVVTYNHVNDPAQAWLNSNGNPTTVTFDLSSATIESDLGSTTPAVGDGIAVAANTPASGLVLPAVHAYLYTPEGQQQGLQRYGGVISAINPDGTVVVTYVRANDPAQAWLVANGNPSTVTFDLTNATIESATSSTTPTAGEHIVVSASTPSSGTVLSAVTVYLGGGSGEGQGDGSSFSLQGYAGTVTGINPDGTIVVRFNAANDVAQAWLAANGSPSTVTFDVSSAHVFSDSGATTAAVGDVVVVQATTPTSGLVLSAVAIGIHVPDTVVQRYAGQVSALNPDGTVVVSFVTANEAAQAWLAANGSPSTVTFDVSSAHIYSNTSSTTISVGSFVLVQATAPVSGTTLNASVVLIASPEGH